jgi:hypothetical protein
MQIKNSTFPVKLKTGTGDVLCWPRQNASWQTMRLQTGSPVLRFTASMPLTAYLKLVERDFTGALKVSEAEMADPDENRSRLASRAAIHVFSGVFFFTSAHKKIARNSDQGGA